MAVFAHQADVPVIFAVITRVGWSHHRLVMFEPVYPDRHRTKQDDWQRVIQEIFSRIETAIREQPEQWFWYNKRWILDPLEDRKSQVGDHPSDGDGQKTM